MAGHPGMGAGLSTPRMVGQDAFGAIREIVRILDADPKTDWSKVDLEALRQHLIDMNEVNATAMSGSRRTSKSSTEIPNASAAASTAAKLITLTPGSSVKTVAGAGAFTSQFSVPDRDKRIAARSPEPAQRLVPLLVPADWPEPLSLP